MQKKVKELFETMQGVSGLVGGAVALIRNGKVDTWFFGHSDRETGLPVSEENVRVGMSRAELSHHCALWSISPLMLSDRIQNDKELAVSLHDLSALVPHLPSPRHLWLDDALTIHIPLPEWIDAVHDKDDTTIPSDASTCIVIGGDKFIQKIVAAAKKRQL
jgi:hypothetical protein